ncbi:MAG: YggS family pyridoxal phosphate-dependent enzyme [SAR86 cluster bacterium]|uniref:Pyridoxal phosphate homeostasis protein n=1 Tax=SAR86 cluster bacterium TaxID=2030880 RepID=A0A2A5B9U9_9GAMM|nr:MAG: YggS family pyridoxal phosphate-dependent enzyme [SAR86 cluster bacterium]
MTIVAENINHFTARLRLLEQRYGRPANSVNLLAVSKRQSIEKITEAHNAGQKDFGENYLQEAVEKIQKLQALNLTWHFIGPIQANKTRAITEHFQWVHSVDRAKIALRLSEQRKDNSSKLNVCVQVNLSNEASKAGVTLEEAKALCEYISKLSNLSLRGLMAIPAPQSEPAAQRASFQLLTTEFTKLQVLYAEMDTLSMGMSADYEAAIAEGSSLIRIGTAIFGARA